MLLDWNLLYRLPEQVLCVFQEKDEFQQVGGFFYFVFYSCGLLTLLEWRSGSACIAVHASACQQLPL